MQHDVIIIGGGHNGLTCAAYLARAGLDVLVLERRVVLGGAAVTEEFHPGFRNSVASYTVSLLHPKVIADLRLAEHGLRIVTRPFSNFLPLPDGNYLASGADLAATQAQFARFSDRDAARLPDYYAMLDTGAEFLRSLLLETPPNVGGGLRDLVAAARAGNRLRRLPMPARRDLLDLFTKSAGDILDRWFEADPVKALFGFDAIVGSYASPYAPGSAYVLLHHVFGEVNGEQGEWGHAIGGMGAISEAIAAEARSQGATLRTDAAVRQVLVEGGRACGVELEGGEQLRARAVAANVNPKLLCQDLLPAEALPADFRERMAAYRCGSGSFRINVALERLPRFRAAPASDPAFGTESGIIIAPSLGYMDRAWLDARLHGFSRKPVVEMLIPSTLDDSLAPPGQHVASLFCQQFDPALADWDAHRDAAIDTILNTVEAHAPGFRASVLAVQAFSPLDLERTFGLTGGDIFHGALSLDQLYSNRPVMGHADYRLPVPGLYLCGSGAHPGGGVTGVPGHNAAREVLRDLR